MDPEDLASLLDPTFTVVRRGYDQTEVRRALILLAGELRAGREREALLSRLLAEAEQRAEAIDPLDPSHLTKLLGDEVARILDAARAAAVEIRVRADDAATRLFDETKSEAAADAAAIIEQAQREAREILDLATEQRDERRDERRDGTRDGTVPTIEPAVPVHQRRSGIDPARTADLFASLRQAQEVPTTADATD